MGNFTKGDGSAETSGHIDGGCFDCGGDFGRDGTVYGGVDAQRAAADSHGRIRRNPGADDLPIIDSRLQVAGGFAGYLLEKHLKTDDICKIIVVKLKKI